MKFDDVAMDKSGKVALGRFVLRTKQYLATLRVREGVLVLATMLYADEVISVEDLDVQTAKDTKPSRKELDMATSLIDSLTNDFELDKYTDEYREKRRKS